MVTNTKPLMTKTIKKFKKKSHIDQEFLKERKKHRDKATYRALKQEESEYAI